MKIEFISALVQHQTLKTKPVWMCAQYLILRRYITGNGTENVFTCFTENNFLFIAEYKKINNFI